MEKSLDLVILMKMAVIEHQNVVSIPLDGLITQPGLPNADGTMPSPLPYTGPALQGYIAASILAPNSYSRYETTTQDAMATVIVDQGGGVTPEEATQIAQWLMNFQ